MKLLQKSNSISRFATCILITLVVGLALCIRLYKLDSLPSSVYWEEAALGYDAYSILKTGKDHHGNSWPIASFISFGDWKPSGYFYALVPFIAAFDLSILAVRLPAALAGTSLVLAIGFLNYLWWKNTKVMLAAMFMTTISSWLIMFSRGGWEVMLATSLIAWGVVTLELWWQKNRVTYLFMSVVLLSAAAYTYHSARFVAPALGLVYVALWSFKHRKKIHIKEVTLLVTVGLFALIINSPWLLGFRTGQASQRLSETSAFSDVSIVEKVNQDRDLAGDNLINRFFFHRYWAYLALFFKNAASHTNPDFLFLTGDSNPRHSTQFFGILYPLDVLLLILGCATLLAQTKNQKHKRVQYILIAWLIIGLFPAALTKAVPHALRILPASPVIMTILALGWWQVAILIKQKVAKRKPVSQAMLSTLFICMVCIYSVQFLIWGYDYVQVYQKKYAQEWQVAYTEIATIISTLRQRYPDTTIAIDRELGRPLMMYWFYSKTEPKLVQNEESVVEQDQAERLEYRSENIKTFRDKPLTEEKVLYIYPKSSTYTTLPTTTCNLITSNYWNTCL